jgi:ribosomal protein L24E
VNGAPNRPIVGIAATPDGGGYDLVASDGGIFTFGDAAFHGSTGALELNKPVVGMATAPGGGYWLVASDGGIFAFGSAQFYGSTGALHLNKPVVGMATAPGGGYWLVASDGGIFAFGSAQFYGSTGSLVLNTPIVGMESNGGGTGYRFVASDGGIFDFGSSGYHGSAVGVLSPPPPSGLIATGVGWSSSGLEGPMPAPGSCHYGTAANGLVLPDPTCTPGAINTAVTQADIRSTICTTGYTDTVRPPVSITEPAKYKSMSAYNSTGSATLYEYDHLVPLELGGSSDVRNLWPEPHAGGSYTKDGVEGRLNAVVCSGQVTLAAAQQAIAANWTTAEATLGVSP